MFSTVARSTKQNATRPLLQPGRMSFAPIRALLDPLQELLISGGDDRLKLLGHSGVNAYGCAAAPRPDIAEFASSTASTISEEAYNWANYSRLQLLGKAPSIGLETAFDNRVDEMRRDLRMVLGLDPDVEIVFAPSGTDAVLHATFLATELMGAPLVDVMMAPDETGSGVPAASIGRHFGTHTALGHDVTKGNAIDGFPSSVTGTSFAGRDADGNPLNIASLDRAVLALVRRAIERGERVLLGAMDCSRTGLTGPSLACLDDISAQWPDSVMIMIDACQMRLSRARLREYLAKNFLVLITGSKFFTGPAFSGALLVPRALSETVAAVKNIPEGLHAYTARSSWPRAWDGIRSRLSPEPNYGEWLRWEAALEEMRAYFAVPKAFRMAGLHAFAAAVQKYMAEIDGIEVAPSRPSDNYEEPLHRSIVPFFLRKGRDPSTQNEAVGVYRALNDKIASGEPSACHFGQPIAMNVGQGVVAGAFRASLSARTISRAWVPNDPETSQQRFGRELEKLSEALEHVASFASRGSR